MEARAASGASAAAAQQRTDTFHLLRAVEERPDAGGCGRAAALRLRLQIAHGGYGGTDTGRSGLNRRYEAFAGGLLRGRRWGDRTAPCSRSWSQVPLEP